MLTFINVKFMFIGKFGDEGLFRSASVRQIADVVRQVVFLLFLLCF